MTKVKAMRNKILAEMIDDPGQETTTAGGIILLEKDGTENACLLYTSPSPRD